MSEENKAIVRRFHEEIWNKGNLDAIDELVSPNLDRHHHQSRGSDSFKEFVIKERTVFPDFNVTVEDLIAEGDKVVVRRTNRGTHMGEWLGVSATGKKTEVATIAIFRIADGKIEEIWAQNDRLGLLQQIGAVPDP